MKCNESIHIRISKNVREALKKQAQTSGVSFNKDVSDLLEKTITEGGSVESRLDKLELKLYELQYVNELQE